MNCYYCGKKERGAHQLFYKLDQDGHIICQSCMNAGYWKNALEIIEHNKKSEYEDSWGRQYAATSSPEDAGIAMKKIHERLKQSQNKK